MEYQVVKFVIVDFTGAWQRGIGTVAVSYKAMGPQNEVAVVKEVPGTGNAITYHYRLKPDAEVDIIGDVIHIPARCFKSEPGNTVKCG
jgi:hypothetical protein